MAKQSNLGQAIVFITGDLGGLNKALKDSQKLIKQNMGEILNVVKDVGEKMAVAGAAITAGLGLAINSVQKLGSEIHDLALKSGASTEMLSGLKYAAEQTGTTIDAVAVAFKKMQKTIGTGQAEEGAAPGGGHSAIAQLGIDMAALQRMKPDQQFLAIAAALRQMGAGTAQAALAQQIFGRSGTDVLPMINDETMSLDDFIKKAQKLGIVLSQEDANAADAFGDNLNNLKQSFTGLMEKAITPILPMLTQFVEYATGIIVAVKDWVSTHKKLAAEIVLGAGALGLLLTLVGGVAVILPSLVTGLGMLAAAFSALWLPVLTATAVIYAGVLAWQDNLGGFRDWLMPFMENMELVFRGGWQRIWDGIVLDFKIDIELIKKEWVDFQNWANDKFSKLGKVMGFDVGPAPASGFDSTNLNNLTAQKNQLNAEKLKAIGGKTFIAQAADHAKEFTDWIAKATKGFQDFKSGLTKGVPSGGGNGAPSGWDKMSMREKLSPLLHGNWPGDKDNREFAHQYADGSWGFTDAETRRLNNSNAAMKRKGGPPADMTHKEYWASRWSEIADMNFGKHRLNQRASLDAIGQHKETAEEREKFNQQQHVRELAKGFGAELRSIVRQFSPPDAMTIIKMAADEYGNTAGAS